MVVKISSITKVIFSKSALSSSCVGWRFGKFGEFFTSFTVLSYVDIFTSFLCLALGAVEINPLAQFVMWNPFLMFPFTSLGLLALFLTIKLVLKQPNLFLHKFVFICLIILNLRAAVTVTNNIALILTLKGI